MASSKLNKIYSILLRGSTEGAAYYKRAVSDSYQPSTNRIAEAALLRGGSSDPTYWCFVADAVIGAALASPMRDDIFEYDLLSTYILPCTAPVSLTMTLGMPNGVSTRYEELLADRNWALLSTQAEIQASLGQAVVNGVTYPYTVSGGLSCPVPVGPGVNLRLRGATSGSFTLTIRLVRPPVVDLLALKNSLDAAGAPWSSKYAALRTSGHVGEWLGAFLLDYCATEEKP